MNNGLKLFFLINKKFIQILKAIEELPDLSQVGNLKIYHLIILKIIKKNKFIATKDIISSLELVQISKAQRYRYIDHLIDHKIIKYHSKGILALS